MSRYLKPVKLSKKTFHISRHLNAGRFGECLIRFDDTLWLYRFNPLSLNAELSTESGEVLATLKRQSWWRRNKFLISTSEVIYKLEETFFNTLLIGPDFKYENRSTNGFFDKREAVSHVYHDKTSDSMWHHNDVYIDIDSRYEKHTLALITAACYMEALKSLSGT